MIVIRATVPIDPEKRDEAERLIENLVEQSQQEAGVFTYQAAADVEDPNVFRFFEHYEDEDAFDAHAASQHFLEFQRALPELLDGEPDSKKFEVQSMSTVEL